MIPRVFLVTDRALVDDLPRAVETVLARLPTGLCAVLLREKDLPVRALLELAKTLRKITHDHASPLIVSGRIDVAIAAEADGVHCGGEAPYPADLRRVAPPGFLIGASIHGDERPPQGADYALLSPVFATNSKPGVAPIGLAGLRAGVARAGGIPIIALGGIDGSNAKACIEAGACGVGMREALMRVTDEIISSIDCLKCRDRQIVN